MARTSFGRSPGPKKSVSFKYASKFVGSRIDIVSEKILTLVKKNPKATEKWMHKMKLSVLKKISDASKIAFKVAPVTGDQEKLKASIEELKIKIENKKKSIEQTLRKCLESPLSGVSNDVLTLSRRKTVPGALAEVSDSILEKYSQIDSKIKELSTMFPTRMTPLTNSILSVERLGPMDAPAIHSSTAAFSSNSSSSSVSSHSQSRSSHTAKGNVSEATGDLTNQTLIRGLQGSHVSPLAQLEHHLRTE